MAINLRDLPQAVRDYLDNKVTVTVSALQPANGLAINPNETFTFVVSVTNATAAAGGIALANVRYELLISPPNVAKLLVPTGGSATASGSGDEPLPPNAEVTTFIFSPSGADPSSLQVGETDSLTFAGKAGSSQAGGGASISARIRADVDLNELFPRNESSAAGSKGFTVVG